MKVHTCPKCGTTARNESQLEKKFGWRVTSSVGYVPQSWCKECRNKPTAKATKAAATKFGATMHKAAQLVNERLKVPFKLNKSQKAVMAEIEKNAGQPIRVQKFPFVTTEQQMQIDETVNVSDGRVILQGLNRDDLKSEYAKHFPGDTNKDRRSYRFMFSKLERKLRR